MTLLQIGYLIFLAIAFYATGGLITHVVWTRNDVWTPVSEDVAQKKTVACVVWPVVVIVGTIYGVIQGMHLGVTRGLPYLAKGFRLWLPERPRPQPDPFVQAAEKEVEDLLACRK